MIIKKVAIYEKESEKWDKQNPYCSNPARGYKDFFVIDCGNENFVSPIIKYKKRISNINKFGLDGLCPFDIYFDYKGKKIFEYDVSKIEVYGIKLGTNCYYNLIDEILELV